MFYNEETALDIASELAKIICANSIKITYPSEEFANDLSDFMLTLANGLAGKSAE